MIVSSHSHLSVAFGQEKSCVIEQEKCFSMRELFVPQRCFLDFPVSRCWYSALNSLVGET